MGRSKRDLKFRWNEVCVVHTVQRCVRRAFLMEPNNPEKKNYLNRRQWVRDKLKALASVYAIDILNYAILSNHVHLVIRNRPDVVAKWSNRELAVRWLRVFPGKRLELEHLGDPTKQQIKALLADQKKMREIRMRMSDISWFMRSVAEPIARIANQEDECTGHFWEGRFKAQRIVDEAGLLTCAMYVDLNPIRAAMAESVMNYKHTSAYDRIEGAKGNKVKALVIEQVPDIEEEGVTKPRRHQRRNGNGPSRYGGSVWDERSAPGCMACTPDHGSRSFVTRSAGASRRRASQRQRLPKHVAG